MSLANREAFKLHLSLDQNQICTLAVKQCFLGLNDCAILDSATRLTMTLVDQCSPLGQYYKDVPFLCT